MRIMTSCRASTQLGEHPLRPFVCHGGSKLEAYVETLPQLALPVRPACRSVGILRAGNWLQVGPIVDGPRGCFTCVRGRFLQHVPGGRFWNIAGPNTRDDTCLSPIWAHWVMTTVRILLADRDDHVFQANMITGEWRSGRFVRVSSCECARRA
jgi:hypothetical protein